MFHQNWKKEIFTVPNCLSMFRLILIPVYLYLYQYAINPGDYLLTASVLTVSCLTDLLDGRIARKYGMVSTLGKILDPVADKATQLSLTACLSLRYPVLYPLLLLLAAKETLQLLAGLLVLRRGKMLPGALPEGKICTAILFISLITLVLIPGMALPLIEILAGLDSFFLCLSFCAYWCAYRRMFADTA